MRSLICLAAAPTAIALLFATFQPSVAGAEPLTDTPDAVRRVTTPVSAVAPGTGASVAVGIRVFDNSGLQLAVRMRALEEAAKILQNAQLSVAWVDCPRGMNEDTSSGCDTVPASAELIVRMARGPRSPVPDKRLPLGYSLIDAAGRTGTFATVFVDRVEWLAREGATDPVTLVGRTIAHEVGHLMLGTIEHGSHGLMRARWTAAELRRPRADDWQFSVADRARILEAHLLRSRQREVAALR